jgi:hypothetical protein
MEEAKDRVHSGTQKIEPAAPQEHRAYRPVDVQQGAAANAGRIMPPAPDERQLRRVLANIEGRESLRTQIMPPAPDEKQLRRLGPHDAANAEQIKP